VSSVPWGQQKQGFYRAQKFIPSTLHKMRRLAEIRSQRGLNFRIEVDGGLVGDTVSHVFMFRCSQQRKFPLAS
jgi:pentose-5-phosphate-3-epimerase